MSSKLSCFEWFSCVLPPRLLPRIIWNGDRRSANVAWPKRRETAQKALGTTAREMIGRMPSVWRQCASACMPGYLAQVCEALRALRACRCSMPSKMHASVIHAVWFRNLLFTFGRVRLSRRTSKAVCSFSCSSGPFGRVPPVYFGCAQFIVLSIKSRLYLDQFWYDFCVCVCSVVRHMAEVNTVNRNFVKQIFIAFNFLSTKIAIGGRDLFLYPLPLGKMVTSMLLTTHTGRHDP